MELVEGRSLVGWENEGVSIERVLDVFLQVGEGVAAAHRAGVIHRDIKPANILLDKHGRAQVTDFGLAWFEDLATRLPCSPEREGSLRQTGALLGTPYYMSPEQLAGQQGDARSDQFCFCVALYQMLYSERPYHGGNVAELASAIDRGAPHTPSAKVPKAVRRIVLMGLNAAPEKRHASMNLLLTKLRRARPRKGRKRVIAHSSRGLHYILFFLI